MNKNLKIGLIVLSVVGVSVGTYFAIKFYNLKQAYKKSLTPDDVLKIVDVKTKDLGTEMEEDPDLKRISSETDATSTDEEDSDDSSDYEDN
jgi:hypothetical protein